MRSCRRSGLPCQNSIVSGINRYPPQCGGSGMSSPNSDRRSATVVSSSPRLASGELCRDAQAPSREPGGRLWKYAADSSQSSARLATRSEEHTSELQSRENLVCRLLLEKKKNCKTKN